MARPYLSMRLDELKDLYSRNASDARIVGAIREELKHRKSRSAKQFLAELKRDALLPASNSKSAKPRNRAATRPGALRGRAGKYPLTDEQVAAVDKFRTGESLKVSAFAGAGKTSTLVAMAESATRPGVYLAFNRAIASEARERFPRHVDCRTTHSLAFNAVKGEYRDTAKLVEALNARAIADTLSLESLSLSKLRLSATLCGALVKRTLAHFCQSSDQSILGSHVPIKGRMGLLSENDRDQLFSVVTAWTKTLWSRMLDPADHVPLGHDGYLKLWALSEPTIAQDFILLDEAQDTNAVVLDVLSRQPAQLIYVGDRHQQVYEWRGAVNAMQLLHTRHQCSLTMSFRFGDSIAAAANQILRVLKEPLPIRGNPQKQSALGTVEFDALLSRTNGALVGELIGLLAEGKKVHVVGGVGEILRLLYGARDLQNGKPTDVPEFFGFSNWNEVLTAVKDDELPA